MQTKILSLKGPLFEGDATLVNAQTKSGEITILPGHRPLVSVLSRNSRIYLDSMGKRQSFEVKGGFLHLDGSNKLTLLVD